MENNRLAVVAIVVENPESVEKLNETLHEFRQFIIGRMGIPCKERGISLVSVAMDAPSDKISALSGRLGMIEGVSAKAAYSKV